jgi:hypothetical protein
MVWGDISYDGSTDLYDIRNGSLTCIRYRDEILGPIVRLCAGAIGSASASSCREFGWFIRFEIRCCNMSQACSIGFRFGDFVDQSMPSIASRWRYSLPILARASRCTR